MLKLLICLGLGVAASATHYGNPANGCESDEQAVQITGVAGSFCSPDCTSAACPTDVPSGVTATPQCALKSSTGNDKKCALICSPSTDEASLRAGDAQCGTGASCKSIQTVGVCTYDSGHRKTVLSLDVATDNTFDLAKPAQELFDNFRATFNKTYEDDQEARFRFLVFQDNLRSISDMNMDEDEEVFGVTKFSDLTPEEFKTTYLGYRRLNETRDDDDAEVHPVPAGFAAPSAVDWRTKGAVTAVKDQGQCGSCWAYSATEEIESEWILAGNKMTEFSPQQIISCDKTDLGCNGGDTTTAYAYVQKAKGLALESAYKDTSAKSGKTGKCKKGFKTAGGDPTGFTYATKPCSKGKCKKQNLATLQSNVASKAPASICVNAGAWQNYVKGVMSAKKCGSSAAKALDHCVQLVGYSSSYWIVRNSWNTDWGIKGYIHLQAGQNTCGLANEATFVSFAK